MFFVVLQYGMIYDPFDSSTVDINNYKLEVALDSFLSVVFSFTVRTMQTIFIIYDLCVGGKNEYNLEISQNDPNPSDR